MKRGVRAGDEEGKELRTDFTIYWHLGVIMKTFKEFSEENNEAWPDPETAAFMAWMKDFQKKFPMGDYDRREDRYNLLIGRIFTVLDELGETNDLPKYVGNFESSQNNYPVLLGRLVKFLHPDKYEMWKQEFGE